MKIGLFNTAFVGDLALMSRLVDALARAGHDLVLFSNGAGCQLYKMDSRIQKTVVVKKSKGAAKISSVFQIAAQIRSEQLDVLILAHRSLTSAAIALLSGQARVVTFPETALARFFFNKSPDAGVTHESSRYLLLANGFSSEEDRGKSGMSLFGDVSLSSFSSKFPDFMMESRGKYFVCAPGSVWNTKKYPPELLAELLGRLLSSKPELRCVLSGGPADFQTMTQVIDGLKNREEFKDARSRLIDARDCLPLSELIELIRGAQFVLTPDSAPLHIASATGTRAFAFFGPTPSDTGFGPLSEKSEILSYPLLLGRPLTCQPCSKHGQNICPLGHHSCLADLPPQLVAERMLNSLR